MRPRRDSRHSPRSGRDAVAARALPSGAVAEGQSPKPSLDYPSLTVIGVLVMMAVFA
jgi:hypothetical protein